jgi:hypothetical protein
LDCIFLGTARIEIFWTNNNNNNNNNHNITVAVRAYEGGQFTTSNNAQSGHQMVSIEGDGEGVGHESFNL